jgi:hypothetical protein
MQGTVRQVQRPPGCLACISLAASLANVCSDKTFRHVHPCTLTIIPSHLLLSLPLSHPPCRCPRPSPQANAPEGLFRVLYPKSLRNRTYHALETLELPDDSPGRERTALQAASLLGDHLAVAFSATAGSDIQPAEVLRMLNASLAPAAFTGAQQAACSGRCPAACTCSVCTLLSDTLAAMKLACPCITW